MAYVDWPLDFPEQKGQKIDGTDRDTYFFLGNLNKGSEIINQGLEGRRLLAIY